MSPAERARRRHVWVDGPDDTLVAGLVVTWRRREGEWEALVATGYGDRMLLQWRAATALRPVRDDGWRLSAP